MDTPWVVLLSTIIPAAIVLAGRWLDKRRGVPASTELAIDDHVQFVVETLNREIEQRKKDAADCASELAIQRNERVKERDGLQAQINVLEHKNDLLQARVNRLLTQLNGTVEK